MRTVEFGEKNRDVVLLLHGGGLSWWNYRDAAAILGERFHVVLPVLDGHSDSGEAFTTIEENAARIIRYVEDHFGGQVLALGGLSLGGQIAVEMLTQRPDIAQYALLESALVSPSQWMAGLIGPTLAMSYGLIRQRWFAKLQFAYLRLPEALFEDYFQDTCRIRREDMTAFLKANSTYEIKPELSLTRAKVKIVAGSREQKNIRDSARLLHKAIPDSSLEILKGMYHGELSIGAPERYAQMLEELCREADENAV